MSRIKQRFASLRAQDRTALIPYITAGDPQPSVTVPLMHALVASGADLLELGIPFSDPMADGPVIQAACERALKHHVSLHDVLDMVITFRKQDSETPVILMGYLNPVEVMGYETFAAAAVAAGVDGVITVDMPPEEADEYVAAFKAHDLDPVFLLAPNSDAERMQKIAGIAGGFLYYVSFKGVTGANRFQVGPVAEKLAQIRQYTDLPLGVGFGIRDAATAAQVAQVADAVVVGSAIVARIAEAADTPERITAVVSELVAEMRKAMDAVPADAASA